MLYALRFWSLLVCCGFFLCSISNINLNRPQSCRKQLMSCTCAGLNSGQQWKQTKCTDLPFFTTFLSVSFHLALLAAKSLYVILEICWGSSREILDYSWMWPEGQIPWLGERKKTLRRSSCYCVYSKRPHFTRKLKSLEFREEWQKELPERKAGLE